jgi:antitoxin component of MazEF toxin-antitoxin module
MRCPLLAVPIPFAIMDAIGINLGERVELEVRDGTLVIHRHRADPERRADAKRAAAEMIAARQGHALGEITVRELRDDGRPA